ncbi:MAG: manganese efflux pump [Bacilli bacterium]
MEIITLILIGISLSLDAFSLSIAYGLIDIKKTQIIQTSISVGIFHFFMPLLGMYLGSFIFKYINIDSKYILIIILSLVVLEMIKSLYDKEKAYEMNILNIIIFSFLVSIDSFSVGIGINYITSFPIIASLIFSFFSFFFTLLGFTLGKYLSEVAGIISKKIGIVILIILIIYFVFK